MLNTVYSFLVIKIKTNKLKRKKKDFGKKVEISEETAACEDRTRKGSCNFENFQNHHDLQISN